MATNLDSFFQDKFSQEGTIKLDKVLCIVEGGDELSFIKRVYEIYNSSIECETFLSTKIKLSYGRGFIEWQGNTSTLKNKNKKKCNFQGGDYQEKAPFPILTSLNNEDLELYKAIIVMFDKDRDSNNEVEIKSKNILKKYSSQVLFLSNPCFEKETITFFNNDNIQQYISENYSIINNSKCKWYKSNYSKLLQFNPIQNKRKLSTIIPILNKQYIESTSIETQMKSLILFLKRIYT